MMPKSRKRESNVYVIMKIKLNHRPEMEVQLYLNKIIRLTGVFIAAYDSKSIKTVRGDERWWAQQPNS